MASLRWTPDTRRRVLMCCSDQHVQAAFTEVYVERDVIDVAVRCYLCQNWMELNSQDSTDEEGDSSQDNGHGDGDHHEDVSACETESYEPEPDAFGGFLFGTDSRLEAPAPGWPCRASPASAIGRRLPPGGRARRRPRR